MSDEKQNGKGGFDAPKKPRATFGDVMLGIPAGRGGEERGGGKPSGDRRPRGDSRPPAPTPTRAAPEGSEPPSADSKSSPRRDRPGARPGAAPKSQGPLVVVRRASGVVETRALDDVPASSTAPSEVTEAEAATTARHPEPTPVVPSALFEDVHEHETFAQMFESSANKDSVSKKHFRLGEKVKGTIFQLGADTAFVSLGGKSEAMIELRELKDDEGILRFGVGDTVEAHVVEAGARGIVLSRTLSRGSASLALLGEARASGLPVEGMVLSVNKGGFEVAVGDTRAFCPISQMDLRFVDKPDQYIGEKLRFRVTEVRERNVVLSRRSLLEEESKALAQETRKNLAEGKTVKGKVTGVRDFGAFVDLGGVEGLIPVSELAHSRVGHPSEVVKVGDEVEVDVLKVEPGNPNSPDKSKQKERITLSLRSRQEDPWTAVLAGLQEGAKTKGKVVRLQPFGAFIELAPGVDGLIHVSALSNRRIAHPRDVVTVGQEVQVLVEKIDGVEKRIGLRLIGENGEAVGNAEAAADPKLAEPAEKREQAPRPRAGQVVTGKIDRIEQYGVFLAFPGGKGLIPASETGTERGTDMKRAFSLGQELKASILEIDSSNKIRLSITAAARAEERADVEAWTKTQPKGTGGKGFGTLADLLKNLKK